jgi:hypothetical protein
MSREDYSDSLKQIGNIFIDYCGQLQLFIPQISYDRKENGASRLSMKDSVSKLLDVAACGSEFMPSKQRDNRMARSYANPLAGNLPPPCRCFVSSSWRSLYHHLSIAEASKNPQDEEASHTHAQLRYRGPILRRHEESLLRKIYDSKPSPTAATSWSKAIPLD